MKIHYEHIEPSYPLGWRYLHFETSILPAGMHAHPEFELTYMLRGSGTRFVGDSVEEYQNGDLVLIGPHLAHTYASIPDGGTSEAVVAHFTRDFLGEGFFDLPGFVGVGDMLEAASHGLRFADAPAELARLDGLPPAERTVALLGILVTLSRQWRVSLATGHASVPSSASARRIEAIVDYVHENYRSEITLADIAAVVHMNASAVSRLFSQTLHITLNRYIAIVRLNAACRMLRDTDLPIATIATDSGFGNLSNFNRRFRALKRTTPREYRLLARSSLGDTTTMEELSTVRFAGMFRMLSD